MTTPHDAVPESAVRGAMEPAPWERDDHLCDFLYGDTLCAAMEPAPWERDDPRQGSRRARGPS